MNAVKDKAKNRMVALGDIDRAEAFSHSLMSAHCDGALKSGADEHAGLGIAAGIAELALNTLKNRGRAAAIGSGFSLSPSIDAATRKRLVADAGKTPLAFSLSGARVWMQPVNSRKLAMQWMVPANVIRNCCSLVGSDKPDFILRLYRQNNDKLKWKASHRTLEFAVDVSRKKCYIKLEQAGGSFTAELGLKFGDGRYVFLARSGECAPVRIMPEIDSLIERVSCKVAPVAYARAGFTASEDCCGVAPECDYAWLDLAAEEMVRATYTDFMREGSRVFRNRVAPIISATEAREAAYEKRKTARQQRKADVAPVKSTAQKITMQRIDTGFAAESEVKEVVRIQHYPVLRGYCAQGMSRDLARKFAVIPHLCRSDNLVAVEHFGKEELAEAPVTRRRRTVHVKSTKELTEAIKSGRLHDKAEIILRGKVKPGRRVRVGGLLIETAEDGSFCVACVIRNGRLHVPVEEVAAVCVE